MKETKLVLFCSIPAAALFWMLNGTSHSSLAWSAAFTASIIVAISAYTMLLEIVYDVTRDMAGVGSFRCSMAAVAIAICGIASIALLDPRNLLQPYNALPLLLVGICLAVAKAMLQADLENTPAE